MLDSNDGIAHSAHLRLGEKQGLESDMLLRKIQRLLEDGTIEDAKKMLQEERIRRWRAAVLKAVEEAFYHGPLNWINHPERVDYRWVYVSSNRVTATATYREKEYELEVVVPRYSQF